MSPTMSAAELFVMAAVISVSLAVMIALVFFADHQSGKQRPHSSEQPAIRQAAGDHRSGPADEPGGQVPERPERQPAVPRA